jgi:hypothetical protein
MIVGRKGDERNGYRVGAGTALLILITLEASLLGSGRLLEIGPLTMKMWLFIAAEIYTLILLVSFRRLKLSTILMLLSFATLLCIGSVRGILQHASTDSIVEDIKPIIYCFVVCFVELTMATKRHLELVVTIIKSAAMIMTLGYVVVMFMLYIGALSFLALYDLLSSGSDAEFMFRGEDGLFFYKGSLYIAIGLIFFAFDRGWLSRIAAIMAIIGLVMTGTRGYLLALMAVILVQAATGKGGFVRKTRYIIVPFAVVAILLVSLSGQVIGKEDSDSVRIETARQVADQITPLSFFLGNGLGVGVEERPVHMENSYLEIFHKQGALGLLWWASMLILLIARYRSARRINYLCAQPLFLSACFVAFESLTNPFINNPIGLFVLIVAMVGLNVISEGQSLPTLVAHAELAVC